MAFNKMTIKQVPIERKTVLVRADYNVPLDVDGAISDDLRIRSSIPTIKYLIDRGCKVIIMSHLGRPGGKRVSGLSLKPISHRLSELLGKDVKFIDQVYGDKVIQSVKKAHNGDVILLENLRFWPEEKANDEGFARNIYNSVKAKYFVQDGFGVVHRAHASTSAITEFMPSVAGLLLEKEVDMISDAMLDPKRPLFALMGGAKVSDKIEVIDSFVKVADKILIGGAMANTFLAYKGIKTGKSLVESSQKETIDRIYRNASDKVGIGNVNDFILLPTDVAVAKSINPVLPRKNVAVEDIASDDIALDIGEKTIERYTKELQSAETAVWNGTMGYAEYKNFSHGSARMAMSLATKKGLLSIIGGGDTADFVLKWSDNDGKDFSHVSTGGGASLDLMAGKKLPGVEALLDYKK